MNKLLCLFIAVFIFSSASVSAQNAYKFIEPNISISYDSNQFKIAQRFSNTTYETESYDFSYQLDPERNASIHLEAGLPVDVLPKQMLDSFLLTILDDIKNRQGAPLTRIAIDRKVREIGNFSCAGIVILDDQTKKFATAIVCFDFSSNASTQVFFGSSGKDLDSEYVIVSTFLKGIKSYSAKEIEKEEKLIKSKYTVSIIPAEPETDPFKYRTKTYIGVVGTTQPLEHRIEEVRLTGTVGQEIFTPDENGKVYIMTRDANKGNVTKKGELVLLNSFGKKVKLPFTFSYVNHGPW